MEKKQDFVENVLKSMYEYYNRIKTIVTSGYAKEKLEKYQNIFVPKVEQHPNLPKLTPLSSTTKIEDIFKYFHFNKKYDVVLENMFEIIEDLNNEIDTTLSEVSQTFILETSDVYDRVILNYNNYVKKSKEINIQLIHKFKDLVVSEFKNLSEKSENDFLKLFDKVKLLLKKYPNTISLYAHIMQDLIDYYSENAKEDKKKVFILLDQIEKDKSWLLNLKTENLFQHKKKLIHQSYNFRTFGFVPITEFMTFTNAMEEIFDVSNLKYNSKNALSGIFKKLAQSQKCNIIVLYRITPNPIQYNTWKLTDWSTAKEYLNEGETTSGIDKKMIERYETIKYISENSKNRFKLTYEIYKNNSKDYVILETYDSEKFRGLLPWIRKTKSYKLPYFRVKNFLDYLENTKRSRISNYNKLLEKDTLKDGNMFFKYSIDQTFFDKLTEYSQIVESSKIRFELFTELKRVINDIIKKEYRGFAKLNAVKIGEILHHGDLLDTFGEIIVEQYYEYEKVHTIIEKKSNFPSSEILCTYLSQLDIIVRQFGRELHDLHRKSKPEPDMDKFQIEQYLDNILKEAINNTISDKKNIYQAILFKDNILNVGM